MPLELRAAPMFGLYHAVGTCNDISSSSAQPGSHFDLEGNASFLVTSSCLNAGPPSRQVRRGMQIKGGDRTSFPARQKADPWRMLEERSMCGSKRDKLIGRWLTYQA
jgi:hypothetical protein